MVNDIILVMLSCTNFEVKFARRQVIKIRWEFQTKTLV
jgi:hypothetical protein